MIFSIDQDNNVTTHDAQPEAAEGLIVFTCLKELAAATAGWLSSRYLDVWNGFAGTPGPFAKLKEIRKFTDRKTAVNRIWGVIQVLGAAPPQTQTDAPPAAQGAPEAATATKDASPKKGAAKAKKGAKKAKDGKPAREGTAKAQVIAMLQRKGGATLAEIMKITGWHNAHTVRGFVSILGSKGGMKIESTKRESDKARVYAIAN